MTILLQFQKCFFVVDEKMKGIITRNPKSDPDHVIRHHAMWSTNKKILVAE